MEDVSKKNELKQKIFNIVENTLNTGIAKALNEENAISAVNNIELKYKGLPKDALAKILIKRAVRKTTVEGAANGGAVSGCETVLALPAPEPSHKAAAISGIVSLISADIAITTKIQMQLVLELAQLYDCPYDKKDEDDVWLIFKTALGLKGIERASGYGRFIFTETAKKQFRKLLRTGIRKAIQDKVTKTAGKQVARYMGEKYLMRLIPIANIGIGAFFNNRITNSIGKWAKVKAKTRSSLFSCVEKIHKNDKTFTKWILPIIFHISTFEDKLTDNHLMIYSQVQKMIKLSKKDLVFIEQVINDENLSSHFATNFKKIDNIEIKNYLLDIAVTSAAVNLKYSKELSLCLDEFSGYLMLTYKDKLLKDKIRYLNC